MFRRLFAPSAGKILSYVQNYCYIVWLQMLSYSFIYSYLKTIFGSTQDLKW